MTTPTPEQVAELIQQLDDACPIVSDENGRTDYGLTDRIRRATIYLSALHADNARLREMLWLRHGCGLSALYGDDGEMQCRACSIDFNRGAPEDILAQFIRNNIDAALSPTTPGDAREGASRD